MLLAGRGVIAAPLSCRIGVEIFAGSPKTYWTKVLYTAVGTAGENASDYVTDISNAPSAGVKKPEGPDFAGTAY